MKKKINKFFQVWNSSYPSTKKFSYDVKPYCEWVYPRISQFNTSDSLLLVNGNKQGEENTTIAIFRIGNEFRLIYKVANKGFCTWLTDHSILSIENKALHNYDLISVSAQLIIHLLESLYYYLNFRQFGRMILRKEEELPFTNLNIEIQILLVQFWLPMIQILMNQLQNYSFLRVALKQLCHMNFHSNEQV